MALVRDPNRLRGRKTPIPTPADAGKALVWDNAAQTYVFGADPGGSVAPTASMTAIASGSVAGTTATVTWTTPTASNSQVEYGPTTAYGSSTTLDAASVTSHSVNLTGLSQTTLYHYRVKSTDATGNLTVSADATFTTLDVTAPVVSVIAASAITATSATITWTTNEASDSQVEYGPTTGYGTSTTLNASMVTSHSVGLTGLSVGTLHYRVKSRDASGNLQTSADQTATIASVSTYSSTVMADTPYAYWRLGDAVGATSIADSSGGAHTVTSLLTTVFGNSPGALTSGTDKCLFTNGGGGVRCGFTMPTMSTTNGVGITIEVWFKTDFVGQANETIMGNNAWAIRRPTTNSLDWVGDANLNTGTLLANTWYLLAVTCGAGTAKLYINGVLKASGADNTLPTAAQLSATSVGYWNFNQTSDAAAPSYGWHGYLQELAIYNSVLTAARLLAHYNAGIA